MNAYFQQGDELFFSGAELPKGAKKFPSGILMKSPVTGHAHRAKKGQVYRTETDRFVKGPAIIAHEEHGDLMLPKGIYAVKTVQEYDHLTEESRSVID